MSYILYYKDWLSKVFYLFGEYATVSIMRVTNKKMQYLTLHSSAFWLFCLIYFHNSSLSSLIGYLNSYLYAILFTFLLYFFQNIIRNIV